MQKIYNLSIKYFNKNKYTFVKIDYKIKIVTFDRVYEPAEDSYMLIESINTRKKEKALDMGCGTGIVALHLAKYCDTLAVDLNEKAIKNAEYNALLNKIKIRLARSNLFSNIKEKFDLIAFDPPYLPTYNEDVAWDGGKDGIEIIMKFLMEAKNYLNKNGRIYFVISSRANIDAILKKFSKIYDFKKLMEKSFFFEKLYVYMVK